MITAFRHKGLQIYFETGSVSRIKQDHVKKLRLVLAKLNAAKKIEDMGFPGSGLHQLKGDKKGFWAVSISGNWRVVFKFEEGHAYDVDYIDYH